MKEINTNLSKLMKRISNQYVAYKILFCVCLKLYERTIFIMFRKWKLKTVHNIFKNQVQTNHGISVTTTEAKYILLSVLFYKQLLTFVRINKAAKVSTQRRNQNRYFGHVYLSLIYWDRNRSISCDFPHNSTSITEKSLSLL